MFAHRSSSNEYEFLVRQYVKDAMSLNKANISKLQLFLMGLSGRLLERKEFFLQIEVIYLSGGKEFPLSIEKAEGDQYTVHFNGVKQTLPQEKSLERISEEAKHYDEVTIYYRERGQTLVIEANAKGVKTKTVEEKVVNPKVPQTAFIGKRNYLIPVGKANTLLKEIGILSPEGKIKNDKIRKYNQIDYFVEQLGEVIDKLSGDKPLTILDCACGKSYLSFALNYYLVEVLKKRCHIIGIDISPNVIEASKQMAKNLNYNNMTFLEADLNQYEPPQSVDLIISLHACDTATDMAIALGLRAKARAMVVVPCCHKELLDQIQFEAFAPIFKHGILKTRFNNMLTDGLRALYLEGEGYEVQVSEYISPLETPKNLMIRAVQTGKENGDAKNAYQALCAMLSVRPSLEFLAEGIMEDVQWE